MDNRSRQGAGRHLKRRIAPLAFAAAAVLASAHAAAQEQVDEGRRFYVEGGSSVLHTQSTDSLTAGVMLPSQLFPSVPRQAGPLTLYWDLWASHWQAPRPDGSSAGYSQIGATAMWRHLLGEPGTPWFVELGLGGTVMDRLYETPRDRFSTAFQFTEVLGVGYRFGERQAYELSLRLQHFSNAGIKEPNPGANFVKLRFSMAW
ncbi:lipid A 3-O-deacylase [Pseudacidovorax sp. 1753]|uniref:Lipid A deacylase n=1 Tax=Pseudacidovorax intermedius TaxID=433924 RepID=A0A370F5X5_9BURK|nr:acyloxyacyl hydrolase [Pseudacidovorax intermedius]RDI19055.1 lipid A 3-O-deacylase [Pseudacidovorax intermedius]